MSCRPHHCGSGSPHPACWMALVPRYTGARGMSVGVQGGGKGQMEKSMRHKGRGDKSDMYRTSKLHTGVVK